MEVLREIREDLAALNKTLERRIQIIYIGSGTIIALILLRGV